MADLHWPIRALHHIAASDDDSIPSVVGELASITFNRPPFLNLDGTITMAQSNGLDPTIDHSSSVDPRHPSGPRGRVGPETAETARNSHLRPISRRHSRRHHLPCLSQSPPLSTAASTAHVDNSSNKSAVHAACRQHRWQVGSSVARHQQHHADDQRLH
ncbi:hypothetical protein ACLOJK_028941 [Asimina triloba]